MKSLVELFDDCDFLIIKDYLVLTHYLQESHRSFTAKLLVLPMLLQLQNSKRQMVLTISRSQRIVSGFITSFWRGEA